MRGVLVLVSLPVALLEDILYSELEQGSSTSDHEKICEWMTLQQEIKLLPGDYAVHLDLTAKIRGLASAEKPAHFRPSTIVGDSLQGNTPTIVDNRFDFEVTSEGLYVAPGSSRATKRKFIPRPPLLGIPLIHDFPTKKKQVMGSKKRFLKTDPVSWITNRASSEEISKLLCTTAIEARAYKVYHPGKRTAFQTPATALCVYLDQIMCGLRFPLHPFIIQVCDEFCVGLPQLTPHSITVLIAFIVKCQLLNVPLSIEAFTFLFQLKPLEGTSAWYYICRRHLEFEGFEGSRIKYDNSVLPTSLPTLGKTDWQERFFFLEGPKNSNFPAVWRNGRTNTPEILLDAESYLVINKLLNNNSIKAEVLLDEGNLVRSKVWHHHHVPSTVIILNLPLNLEATKKPETSFQKSKKRKESSTKGSTIIALNLLDRCVKKNKNSTEEEDSIAMGIPRAQDCPNSLMKQIEQSSDIPLVFPETATYTIESSQNQQTYSTLSIWDRLQKLQETDRELLSSIMVLVTRKNQTGKSISSELDLESGYDPNMGGRSVLRESSFAYQLSKNFLTEEDKNHLKELTAETQWHETNHYLAKVMVYHQTLKEDYLKDEDASFYVEEEATKLKNLFENLKKLFANSHENYLSIKKEKDEIEKEMKANHSALEEARKTVQLLQDEKEGYLLKLDELKQSVTKLSSQNANHFHLAISIIKTLILERDMLKGDHIPSIQELNISEEIKQDPGLKKMFEDGVKKISKECYSENEGEESADQKCDSSNPEHEDSSQDEASSS
ncbi:hypothetical protein SLEP1_g36922 [Rubroshorea leprosula]|uniref:Transposase (putative) gypsy type domain-containing protein n=1 Tax=Rubroshorea leprosula TaxID=152421 RepID=A0AAV5KTA2_9ROSI|nr:hypothetical protein SLEP1_g36922 [Rubroshorea leprosula]